MKREPLFFATKESEICYPFIYFSDELTEENPEIEVYEAIVEKMNGIFWCKEEAFCGDGTKEHCGKQCQSYKPRNGKNGVCKHHTNYLYTPGNKVKLTYSK